MHAHRIEAVNQRNRLARNVFSVIGHHFILPLSPSLSLCVCVSKSHICWAIPSIYACTQMIMFRLGPVVGNSVLNLIKLSDYNRMRRQSQLWKRDWENEEGGERGKNEMLNRKMSILKKKTHTRKNSTHQKQMLEEHSQRSSRISSCKMYLCVSTA